MTESPPIGGAPPPAALLERTAELLKTYEGQILNLWIDAIVDLTPNAKRLGRVEIGDHLHDLLTEIVGTLEASAPKGGPDLGETYSHSVPSAMHGRERATLAGYTVGQVVHEYAILRRVIFEFCHSHNLCDLRVQDIISRVIDSASLAAVNEFVSCMQATQRKLVTTLVHDIRTPLGVVSTYVELLLRDGVSDEQKQVAVSATKRNLKRATGMLEELLDVASLDAGQGLLMRFYEGDISREVKTICKEATQVYKRDIRFSIPDYPVTGIFDLALIIRTLENLISNAVKFGDEKTPITVSVTDEEDGVSIRVHNYGNPVPPDQANHIFSFFSGTSKTQNGIKKGWGLGLALIKIVAASHGGQVIFESTEDAGTTFGMTLKKQLRSAGEEEAVIF